MLGKTLFFAACVFLFVSFVIPAKDAAQENLGTFSHTTSTSQPSQIGATQAHSGWNDGDLTLDRQPNGHFYASANVDGVPVRMMVDTGASVIALTANDASAIGIYWDESEIGHIGQGASGPVYGVQTRLDEVEIGGIVRSNVAAVVIPEGLDVSLLGQSYLSQVGGVEISGDKMTFSGD